MAAARGYCEGQKRRNGRKEEKGKKWRGNGDVGEVKMMIKNGDIDADQSRKKGERMWTGEGEGESPEKSKKGPRKWGFSILIFFYNKSQKKSPPHIP